MRRKQPLIQKKNDGNLSYNDILTKIIGINRFILSFLIKSIKAIIEKGHSYCYFIYFSYVIRHLFPSRLEFAILKYLIEVHMLNISE